MPGDNEPDAMPTYIAQAAERQQMNSRQENEHAMADQNGDEDKSDIIAKHTQEIKDMQKRHEAASKNKKEAPEKSEGEPDF